jgi:hypothetical protein
MDNKQAMNSKKFPSEFTFISNEKDKLEVYLDRLHNEERLIADRVGWMLGSQTLFLGTYALLFEKIPLPHQLENMDKVLPITALVIGLMNYLSIMAGVIAIYSFCEIPVKGYTDNKESKMALRFIIGPLLTHILGLLSPLISPLTFFFIWLLAISNKFTSKVTIIVGAAIIVVVLTSISWWIYRLFSLLTDKPDKKPPHASERSDTEKQPSDNPSPEAKSGDASSTETGPDGALFAEAEASKATSAMHKS